MNCNNMYNQIKNIPCYGSSCTHRQQKEEHCVLQHHPSPSTRSACKEQHRGELPSKKVFSTTSIHLINTKYIYYKHIVDKEPISFNENRSELFLVIPCNPENGCTWPKQECKFPIVNFVHLDLNLSQNNIPWCPETAAWPEATRVVTIPREITFAKMVAIFLCEFSISVAEWNP